MSDGNPHASMPLVPAELDQTMAHYREHLMDAVAKTREHFSRCDQIGCPGRHVIDDLTQIIQEGPGQALTALALAVYYLAKDEDLLALTGLEDLLNGGDLPPQRLREGGSGGSSTQSS